MRVATLVFAAVLMAAPMALAQTEAPPAEAATETTSEAPPAPAAEETPVTPPAEQAATPAPSAFAVRVRVPRAVCARANRSAARKLNGMRSIVPAAAAAPTNGLDRGRAPT